MLAHGTRRGGRRPFDRGRLIASEQGLHKGGFIEHLQVFYPFADPEVLDGNAELITDADGHAALGRAVKLGEHKGRNIGGRGERSWLRT